MSSFKLTTAELTAEEQELVTKITLLNPALPLSKIKKWKGAEIIANVQQLVEKCGIIKRKPNKEQEANLAWVESKSENKLFHLKFIDEEEAKTAIQQIIEERQARFRE